jgi:hypothetical protein
VAVPLERCEIATAALERPATDGRKHGEDAYQELAARAARWSDWHGFGGEA